MDKQAVLDRAMSLPGAKRYERYVAALCPFHGDSLPSLMVYPDRYQCLACGASGKPEKLFAETSLAPLGQQTKEEYFPTIPYRMSADVLAYKANREIKNNQAALSYLEDRGIAESVRRYRIGYWDGWFTVPITNKEEEIINIMFRAGEWVQTQTHRRFYQFKGRAGMMMYCPDWELLEQADKLFLVFGLFDAITLALLGYASVTPTIGMFNFKPEWLDFWRKPIRIIPDKGEVPAANKLCAGFGDWRASVVQLKYPGGTKDCNDYLWKLKKPNLLRKEIERQ